VPLLVGVVDPQDELAAMVPRQEPVEQSRPNAADMQEAGWAGGESSAYAHETKSQTTPPDATSPPEAAVAHCATVCTRPGQQHAGLKGCPSNELSSR
jgi:hypothetical protein